MKRHIIVILVITHLSIGAAGFALGIYLLPIFIAPASPTATEIESLASSATFTSTFQRDLKDSDTLHWGKGTVSIGSNSISFAGKLAPGPDYKLYLSPVFVETEAEFRRLKPDMVRIGDVKTFTNFIVPVPETINPAKFNSVIIWCEAFGQFITAARYQ